MGAAGCDDLDAEVSVAAASSFAASLFRCYAAPIAGAATNIEYAFVALSHLSFQRAESQRFCIVPAMSVRRTYARHRLPKRRCAPRLTGQGKIAAIARVLKRLRPLTLNKRTKARILWAQDAVSPCRLLLFGLDAPMGTGAQYRRMMSP